MAMMCRLLVRVVLCALAVIASAPPLFAQNVFSIRFDTVTAKAGDTVTVNAIYTFSSTSAHNINNFTARFEYDSTEAHLLGFVLAGTASGGLFDTITSHRGITALGQSEIDLTNPVLFRMRFRVDRQLSDTAFVRWDTNVTMFTMSSGVDSVVRRDGWVRTPATNGHVRIQTPNLEVKGVTEGLQPDSVSFYLPFMVSNLDSAHITTARLTFTYDSTVLSWAGTVAGSSESLTVDSIETADISGGFVQCAIVLTSQSGEIKGSDVFIDLEFTGLVGLDTVCEPLTNVTLRPLNPDALIGNTDYVPNAICLEGSAPSEVSQKTSSSLVSMYPNPARDQVTILELENSEGKKVEMFDEMGRLSFSGLLILGGWHIPSGFMPGAYEVVLFDASQKPQKRGMLIVSPR